MLFLETGFIQEINHELTSDEIDFISGVWKVTGIFQFFGLYWLMGPFGIFIPMCP